MPLFVSIHLLSGPRGVTYLDNVALWICRCFTIPEIDNGRFNEWSEFTFHLIQPSITGLSSAPDHTRWRECHYSHQSISLLLSEPIPGFPFLNLYPQASLLPWLRSLLRQLLQRPLFVWYHVLSAIPGRGLCLTKTLWVFVLPIDQYTSFHLSTRDRTHSNRST